MEDFEFGHIGTKTRLHQACLKKVDDRIARILRQLESIVESRNNETKSSAGDKFETGRAMMQIEEDKTAVQLADANNLRLTLVNLDIQNSPDSVKMGSLVETSQGTYFLSVGLGKVMNDNETFYCVSAASPMGQVLLGLKVGDSIQFNGRGVVVQNIY